MRPSGRISITVLLLLFGVLYGIWWVATYAQVYLDNIDVKDAVNGAYNDSARSKDEMLRNAIIAKVNAGTLGWHEETDVYGAVNEVGGIGISAEDIVIERDTSKNTVRLELEYTRKVKLSPTSKVKFLKFKVVKEGPLPAY